MYVVIVSCVFVCVIMASKVTSLGRARIDVARNSLCPYNIAGIASSQVSSETRSNNPQAKPMKLKDKTRALIGSSAAIWQALQLFRAQHTRN